MESSSWDNHFTFSTKNSSVFACSVHIGEVLAVVKQQRHLLIVGELKALPGDGSENLVKLIDGDAKMLLKITWEIKRNRGKYARASSVVYKCVILLIYFLPDAVDYHFDF